LPGCLCSLHAAFNASGTMLSAGRNPIEFVSQVLHRGLAVVGDDAFAAGMTSQPAVRVCLGAPRTRDELARGLRMLAEAMTSPAQNVQVI
jgi:DNA-binding transcriptional MocR family regulator